MIVRSMKAGRSFKALTAYLMHDANADTAHRVAFVHTINLAHDDAPSAVHEMYQTYRDRDLLKKEAGVKPGGSRVEKPVKHVSLSWPAGAQPGHEAMVKTVESYLSAMGWQDHQCLVVGHSDRRHAHVHLVVNLIHPERGVRARDNHEHRKAQAWALALEKEQGQIVCPERLKSVAERGVSPTRPAWQIIRGVQPDDRHPGSPYPSHIEVDYTAHPRVWKSQEWKALKERQKAERMAFFEEGRGAYRELRQEIYREVREAYRGEWRDFYALKKTAASRTDLAEAKAALVARQKATLEERCREAARSMRETRDVAYQAVLSGQKDQRTELIDRQERGLTSPHLCQAPRLPLHGPAQPVAKPGLAAEIPTSGGPAATGHPVPWTWRGGLVAQQRSASHRIRRIPRILESRYPDRSRPSERQPIDAGEDRSRAKGKRPGPVAIEPDG